ncbi:MAG: DUF6502 family protein, partial [Pseudomonadota bacterium]
HPLFYAFAKLMVGQSMRFPDVMDPLKAAYVRVVLAKKGKVTDSHISMVTGLQRRDVARLRTQPPLPGPRPNPLARIVALWQSDNRFRGRVLPRTGPDSFDSLARLVAQDVHPRTFLDGLEHSGTISVDDAQVCLLKKSYTATAGGADQLAYLAQNVGDHLQAAQANTQGAHFFERAVHYNRLTKDQVAELHTHYADLQMQVLEQINKMAADLQAAAPKEADHRFRCGGYFWCDLQEEEPPT